VAGSQRATLAAQLLASFQVPVIYEMGALLFVGVVIADFIRPARLLAKPSLSGLTASRRARWGQQRGARAAILAEQALVLLRPGNRPAIASVRYLE